MGDGGRKCETVGESVKVDTPLPGLSLKPGSCKSNAGSRVTRTPTRRTLEVEKSREPVDTEVGEVLGLCGKLRV